jgi:hypothetical protein
VAVGARAPEFEGALIARFFGIGLLAGSDIALVALIQPAKYRILGAAAWHCPLGIGR